MYRPQFAFPPTPSNFRDEDFVYNFDGDNVPALNIRFGPGQTTQRIPLPLQSDAGFLHRGLKMNQAAVNATTLGVQVFDPKDRPLSNDYVSPSVYSPLTNNPAPPLEPEIENPPGASYQISLANLSNTVSTLPLLPEISPVLVDPVGFGHGLVVGNNVPAANAFGPFLFGGDLYMALTPTNPSSSFIVQIFRSQDGGNSWQVLDGGNGPNGNAMVVFDGDHSLICAFSTAAIDTTGDINLQNFDLTAGTWGAVYGTSSPPTTQAIYDVYLRPDGSILVLHNPRAGSGSAVTGLECSIFVSPNWSTTFDAGTGITTLPGYNMATVNVQWSSAILDTNGNLHVFFQTDGQSGPPNWDGRVFYQQIESTNALGTFFNFPGNDTFPTTVQNIFSANPIIVDDQLIIGYNGLNPNGDQYPSIIVGSPLSNPTFQYAGSPGIDPTAYELLNANSDVAPYLAYDGLTVFAVWVADNPGPDSNILRIVYNCQPNVNILSGWGALQIDDTKQYNFAPLEPAALIRPSITIDGNSILVSSEASTVDSEGNARDARFWMGIVEIEPLRIQFRGVKRYAKDKKTQACEVR